MSDTPKGRRSTALTFRLDALATYIQRHGAGSHPLDLAMVIARQAVEEIDNLHAELLERCETMERMASDTPVWLIVFLDGPGRGPEVAQAIHFSADETVIYGTDPEGSNDDRPRACLRCGWTGPGNELRAHLATCERRREQR